MTFKLNYNYYLAIFGTNDLYANLKCWIELLVLKSNTWNHLTMCKQISFRIVTYKQFIYKSYIFDIYV